MDYFSILTTAGLNKLIKATANNAQIVLTQMGVSDSKEPITQDLTALPNERHKFNINTITQSESDANVLICEGVISADVGGFYIRRVGIYTDEGVLFAVGVVPESYKPLLSEGSSKDITIKFYLQVDNAANITLKVDNNIVLATKSHVQSEVNKINAQIATLLNDKLGKTENAVSATKLQTARTINGVAFDGTANITIADNTKLPLATYTTDKPTFATKTELNTKLNANANAVSATKLQTARTINGVAFDGTANITIADNTKLATATYNSDKATFATKTELNTKLSTATYNTDKATFATKTELNTKLNANANAVSATKLQTARTINGVAFDGTRNIMLDMLQQGQQWRDVTSQRRFNVVYTNTTANTIFLFITCTYYNRYIGYIQINNLTSASFLGTGTDGVAGYGNLIIPIPRGATYKLASDYTPLVINSWWELR
ncbi:phage tail protein [Campylobacter gastrosuis]|uniref:Phage tail protein n=1 Tax=Campylobacter gastrosuis TaxID=2974576 RepID=A0ABT7HST6_9BACT|nr:phage tail protein [Campylobacter gastrosuis]MDL0089904.1 phage tail protein [Campylobacter gastrosuis]